MRGTLAASYHRFAAASAASDPGLARLRLAATTIVTLLAVAAVLYGLVQVLDQPIIVAIPGVVLAMIASLIVRGTELRPQATTIVLLTPAAWAAIGLASLLNGTPVVADTVFVAVAVAAAGARHFGPRGLAMGMVAFISYFLALFIAVQTDQLLVVAASLCVAAVVCVLMRAVLRPRHPDRQLQRMLFALGVRAGDVVSSLGDAARAGELAPRPARRLRARVLRAGDTATAVEQHVADADQRVSTSIDNDELGIRVFDFQLAIEALVAGVVRTLAEDGRRAGTSATTVDDLARVQTILQGPAGARALRSWEADGQARCPRTEVDESTAALHRAMSGCVDAWRRVVDPHPDDTNSTSGGTTEDDDEDGSGDGTDHGSEDEPDDVAPSGLGETGRQAIQVGIASALAVVLGTQLSASRWFWAVIAAFVVYIGASTRGEILSKGWQRVLGTLAGVVAGVLVATAVGDRTLLAVALIVASLFLGVYLLSVSAGMMIFFITIMLALLYGLLGMFSVDLLLVRLEETAAGALIGVLVSYVVLPASTRSAARTGVAEFLDELSNLIERSTDDLTTATTPPVKTGDRARALRDTFAQLRTTTKPLTSGISGVSGRSGFRRTAQVLAVCEHHGRMFARLADSSRGVVVEPGVRHALERASTAVGSNIDAWARGVVADMSDARVDSAATLIDELEQAADHLPDRTRHVARDAARHLRTVDQAVCARASELGAKGAPVAV